MLFKHRHNFKQVGYVDHVSQVCAASAGAVTAKVFRCKCGAEQRELTDAGLQQLDWGDRLYDLLGNNFHLL